MTESAAMVTYNHFYQHVVGSVGTPINLVEVQIRSTAYRYGEDAAWLQQRLLKAFADAED